MQRQNIYLADFSATYQLWSCVTHFLGGGISPGLSNSVGPDTKKFILKQKQSIHIIKKKKKQERDSIKGWQNTCNLSDVPVHHVWG
jgi:hypothetical protein